MIRTTFLRRENGEIVQIQDRTDASIQVTFVGEQQPEVIPSESLTIADLETLLNTNTNSDTIQSENKDNH